ncbi:Nitrogen assimilation transcription factor nit-4 [Grifola frondosa]|uniref:Nitrogen assimilation transcription factor nit-4 n=1 Tax=Grifola frondosa TaxID=5627 RepID=A0A1C7LNR1_GRIFR|nr:Nitrogen assimilation transcription factor nit-4 [Grifola frondosa]
MSGEAMVLILEGRRGDKKATVNVLCSPLLFLLHCLYCSLPQSRTKTYIGSRPGTAERDSAKGNRSTIAIVEARATRVRDSASWRPSSPASTTSSNCSEYCLVSEVSKSTVQVPELDPGLRKISILSSRSFFKFSAAAVEDSPDLPPVSSIASYDHHHHKSASSLPIFRFGTDFASSTSSTPTTPFNFMAQQWPNSATSSASSSYAHQQQQQQYAPVDRAHGYALPASINGHGSHAHAHAMALADEYDDGDGDDLADIPGSGLSGLGLPPFSSAGGVGGTGLGTKAGEKQVRRRSSKACDQCRKSKCKCERNSPQDACRNCVMLGTPCTFLGPSRKRGPPKGYIDAIEARLHQTEALIGILLGSKDSRARTILEDLAEDPLAKEIINRVDNSPYGHKGRSRGTEPTPSNSRTRPPPAEQREGEGLSIHATHPSNEWQDQVITRLNAAAAKRNTLLTDEQARAPSSATSGPDTHPTKTAPRARRSRQRRRVETDAQTRSPSGSVSGRSRSPVAAAYARHVHTHASPDVHDEESYDEGDDEDCEDELAIAVGQLSLNEDQQVRFHGKVSGLHLLGVKERQDGRNEGGLWRFPKARVWPPLPPTAANQPKGLDDFVPRLPDPATQELLLELYFTYVHPALPVVHKPSFMEDFRNGNLAMDSPYSGDSPLSDAASAISIASPVGTRRRRVPTLLLLVMFSIAARYSARTSADVPLPKDNSMWSAGDSYMEDAKVILDSTYAASRPSTCQALLLLGYREVGIGAMAQAWLYVGMAVRMAQDLGLHKSAEKWSNIGKNLFTAAELQERRRIWYGCVVMDKYVCAYIGRPVAITERDFDTELPSVDEPEELELWAPHPSPPVFDDENEVHPIKMTPMPGHVISCFNESAKLSNILSMICQTIYAIKPHCCRLSEFARFEKLLSKCIWCTVLLLHRPFIRLLPDAATEPAASSPKDPEVRASLRKNYDMCVQAANHITSIVSVYSANYCPKSASVYLCYYIFTAAIMHVTTLRTYPNDPQARLGLNKCMGVLKRMQILWPSAWRALELLYGAKVNSEDQPDVTSRKSTADGRHKRAADQALDEDDASPSSRIVPDEQMFRQQASYPNVSSQAQTQQSFTLGLDLPSGTTSTYMQSSTGLVDEERISAGMTRTSERQGHRYPQYWNDYSALGQMETTYGVPVIGNMVSQQSHGQQGDQSSIYADQYSMFGHMPPSAQQ